MTYINLFTHSPAPKRRLTLLAAGVVTVGALTVGTTAPGRALADPGGGAGRQPSDALAEATIERVSVTNEAPSRRSRAPSVQRPRSARRAGTSSSSPPRRPWYPRTSTRRMTCTCATWPAGPRFSYRSRPTGRWATTSASSRRSRRTDATSPSRPGRTTCSPTATATSSMSSARTWQPAR